MIDKSSFSKPCSSNLKVDFLHKKGTCKREILKSFKRINKKDKGDNGKHSYQIADIRPVSLYESRCCDKNINSKKVEYKKKQKYKDSGVNKL